MTEPVLTVTRERSGATASLSDGRRFAVACSEADAGLSSIELLQAALGACVSASIAPLLERHGANAAQLVVAVAARNPTLANGFAVGITLPACDDALRARCARAVASCPVLRALNTPIDIHWQMT